MWIFWLIGGLAAVAGVSSFIRNDEGESLLQQFFAMLGFGGDEQSEEVEEEIEVDSPRREYTRERSEITNAVYRIEDPDQVMRDNAYAISELHPTIQDEATAMVLDLYNQGIVVRITEGHRSNAEQNALYAQGRTSGGNVVTNARGGQSYHNYGLAFDVVPVEVMHRTNWAPNDPVWQRVEEAGKRYGFDWGGDFRSITDMPHFQVAGTTTGELRRLMQDGELASLPDAVEARYGQTVTPPPVIRINDERDGLYV